VSQSKSLLLTFFGIKLLILNARAEHAPSLLLFGGSDGRGVSTMYEVSWKGLSRKSMRPSPPEAKLHSSQDENDIQIST